MQKQKRPEGFDDSFYKLAAAVTRTLERNKDGTLQPEQVEELLDAERKFKETILKYRQATEIYKKFLQKVCIQNKNILSARPYFREAATSFSKKITPAIKNEDIEALKTFSINFQFIKFIKENWLGPFPKRAEQLYDRVNVARNKLIENNMPLAINRAKLFYRKVPKSHLTLMDFIQICSMGLAAGIDKWCAPKYSPVFRSVCIGRMVGNMIDSYSETTLHFYPSDRRILYKANSIRGRRGIDDIEELTRAVNESFKQDAKEGKSIPKDNITVSELSSLMNAASMMSADATVNEEGYGVYHYTQDTNQDIEGSLIEREATNKMLILAKNLPMLHRKVLRLKGIKI
jgi:DNA-directed RNA polymerase specialized sigma subunit